MGKASNIELHFVGFLRKENQKLIRKLKIQAFVKDHGYVNHDESIAKLKSANVLWFMVGRRRNIDAILPGKIYEYIGAKKPNPKEFLNFSEDQLYLTGVLVDISEYKKQEAYIQFLADQ